MNAEIKKFFLPVLISAVFIVPGTSAKPQATGHSANAVHRRLVVSLPDRRMALLEDGKVKKVYPVAVGKRSTPSPTGAFTIMRRVTNPSYWHNGEVVTPGPAICCLSTKATSASTRGCKNVAVATVSDSKKNIPSCSTPKSG